jgi:type II secretory pathway pseudopilin PulG
MKQPTGIQGTVDSKHQRQVHAFTFVELLAVIALLLVFALVGLSARAKTSGRSGRVTCFNNKRQIQAAALMYSAEWNNYLIPAAIAGSAGYGWCTDQAAEDWNFDTGNTNRVPYQRGALGAYIQDFSVYSCPNDTLPSANGGRIRSVSMSGAMAGQAAANVQPIISTYMHAWRVYVKVEDLAWPGPANLWAFCDESMFTLNDGYLQMDLDTATYPDIPAYYDERGNCFTFTDGHVEYHKWVYKGGNNLGILSAPYSYGVFRTASSFASLSDTDYVWLRQHTSAK